MDTKEIKKTTANDNANNNAKNNIRPSIPAKDAKTELVKPETPAQTAPATATANKGGDSPAENAQLPGAAKPAETVVTAVQAEPSKKELKAGLQEQNARGLEDTVKLVETLGKKIAQKNKLSNTITNLDSFVVTQNDDKDDVAGDSKFMRCELTISDDGGEEFVTKNPFIIAKVVEMVKGLCIEKLAEVEASIVIP